MIDVWLANVAELARRGGLSGAADARLFHWSAAETVFMEGAYNSARARHPERGWPLLGWYDLLERIVHSAPVVVRGARSFGLKAVARAMKSHGLIETEWGEGLADGTGAMAGAWAAADLAAKDGGELGAVELMREVSRYNEIDCRVMAEVLDHLRREH
jgi:predicted RecB family nuclease